MRIWIDVREACKARKTGKGQWTLRCVTALLARSDIRVTLVTDADIPDVWKNLPALADVRTVRGTGLLWHVRVWRMLRRERANIDVYLSPTSFIVPFLAGRSLPVVPVVHDLIAFRNEPHDRKARFIERLTLPRALATARTICTVSDATAAALHAQFPHTSPTLTVGAGPTVDETNTWTGTGNHLLCIATLCPRKNQLRLIQAFAILRSEGQYNDLRLVLVGGRGWEDEEIVHLARETEGVEWKGFQDEATCSELLRTCKAFAYVSEEEGFGLPVLDALKVGAPVLASDIPSIREVAGDAAVYADPLSVQSIADGLRTVLQQGSMLREEGLKRAEGFSWEKTAERLVMACHASLTIEPKQTNVA